MPAWEHNESIRDEFPDRQKDAIKRDEHKAEVERITKHGIKTGEVILAVEALYEDSKGIGSVGLHEALVGLNNHYDQTAEKLGQEILKR